MKHHRLRTFALVSTAITYLALPALMGAFDVGSRRSPIIYPSGLHRLLFIPACETFMGYKPRESVVETLYSKAYFYGLSERPKSREDRELILNRVRANHQPDSPYLKLIEEHNLKLNDDGA